MVHQSQTRLFPEDNPLAHYHGDLNGDSDTEGRGPSHIVLKTSATNGYIPLWEDSDTFTDAQLERCYELGADMRQTLREAQDRYNADDHKGGSTVSIVVLCPAPWCRCLPLIDSLSRESPVSLIPMSICVWHK